MREQKAESKVAAVFVAIAVSDGTRAAGRGAAVAVTGEGRGHCAGLGC